MPDQSDHVAQAEHNWDLVRHLGPLGSPYSDWVVTGAFYAALHYVDAFLAQYGIHPGGHPERLSEFAKRMDATTYDAYRQLKDDSEYAKYYCGRFADAELQNQIFIWYQQVSATVRKALGLI